jgi:hypothetical protein
MIGSGTRCNGFGGRPFLSRVNADQTRILSTPCLFPYAVLAIAFIVLVDVRRLIRAGTKGTGGDETKSGSSRRETGPNYLES